MTPNEYQKLCERTESIPTSQSIACRAINTSRLMHGAIGASTESGELLDVVKKHLFYGKPIDRTNVIEEAGDLLWYVSVICNALDVSMEDVMEQNIAKLRVRYPEKFTSEAALNRDLDAERKVLE